MTFLTFGEVMLRLAPEGCMRLRQVLPGTLEATFGGGESNVAASLAMLGNSARFLTALPDNAVGDAVEGLLRGLRVDTDCICRRPGRVGIYFLENGANQRGSTVLYDRAGSSVSLAQASEYDFDRALSGVGWVHVTGITPAISKAAFLATLELVQRASAAGMTVSCDLNFRKKLWLWREGTSQRELARECMTAILAHVNVVIGNEEDADCVLGISADGTSVESGQIRADAYEGVAREIVARFPGVRQVAITLRESISASHNNWGAMLFDSASDRPFFAPCDARGKYRPYEIRDIVDRVGGGDSFAAGLLHALRSADYALPEAAIRFAVAASCLKHSVRGDLNYVSEPEVVRLMEGDASGRVKR